ncbi:uncharacterized protein LOC122510642 [Leptopilina heterotoma]|uniref:uncharacterized protein LOC122510642 n=1 Tax=Leptopilina heterotoma TaxID=63436 RepID=UPI001CA7C49A|nr:uncharacterized protein LOC122510642 [Leptopilina heterotoma]
MAAFFIITNNLQALYRKVRYLKLEKFLCKNDEGYSILKHIMALPLLPANEIEETYFEIIESTSLRLRRKIQKFLNYFQKQWIRKVTPQVFSVYVLERRTNNVLESYHRQLKQMFGIKPHIWTFTSKYNTIYIFLYGHRSLESLIFISFAYIFKILITFDFVFIGNTSSYYNK